MTYEEANWAKLSPAFRNAHNALRRTRGQPAIPEPKIDLYVPRPPRKVTPFDPGDKEFIAATRAFFGGNIPGAHAQGEGFSINGQQVSFGLNDAERAREVVARQAQRAQASMGIDEGFSINGRPAR